MDDEADQATATIPPTAAAAYQVAQAAKDLSAQIRELLNRSENPRAKRKLLALCDEIDDLASDGLKIAAEVEADVRGDRETDTEPELASDAMEEGDDGLMKAIPLTVRKAIRRFSLAEVKAATARVGGPEPGRETVYDSAWGVADEDDGDDGDDGPDAVGILAEHGVPLDVGIDFVEAIQDEVREKLADAKRINNAFVMGVAWWGSYAILSDLLDQREHDMDDATIDWFVMLLGVVERMAKADGFSVAEDEAGEDE